jgi:hypothetical protein
MEQSKFEKWWSASLYNRDHRFRKMLEDAFQGGIDCTVVSQINCGESSYDSAMDVFTIYSMKYSGELFRQLAKDMPIGVPFRIVKRENGEMILERVSEARSPSSASV